MDDYNFTAGNIELGSQNNESMLPDVPVSS
jgi:hypothetical protein